MELENYIEIIEKLYSFVNYPFTIVDTEYNTLFNISLQQNYEAPKSAVKFLLNKYNEAKLPANFPYIYHDSDGIMIGVLPLHDSLFALIGPNTSPSVSLKKVSDKYDSIFSKEELSILRTIALGCHVYNPALFANMLSTFYELVYHDSLSSKEILELNIAPVNRENDFINYPDNAHSPASVNMHNYFRFENSLAAAIEEGDKTKLDALINSYSTITLGEIPGAFASPIFICMPLLAIMRRSAILGGADINDTFKCYDQYADIIIHQKAPADGILTMTEASYAFCNLVETKLSLGHHSTNAKKCVQYIRSNISKKITIDDLALVCGQSPRQVSRIFSICFNSGVSEFINAERVKLAKEFLSSSNAKLVDISNHLGFSNQSHFTKVFSQYTGCTPLEYRNRSKQL